MRTLLTSQRALHCRGVALFMYASTRQSWGWMHGSQRYAAGCTTSATCSLTIGLMRSPAGFCSNKSDTETGDRSPDTVSRKGSALRLACC